MASSRGRGGRRGRTAVAAVLAGTLAATLLASCGGPDAEATARSFLEHWQRGEATAAGKLTGSDPAKVAEQLDAAYTGIGAERQRFTLGAVDERDGKATARFQATVRLRSLDVDWRYQGRMQLTKNDAGWRVTWAPSVVHPALAPGQRLNLRRQFPSRAPILGRDGGRLVLNENVVTVGVVPAEMKNRKHSLKVLADEIGIDAKKTAKQIDAAPPKSLLPLITLRDSQYRAAKKKIYDLPGVKFTAGSLPLAKNRQYARQLLGSVGPVSAERLKELGAPYTAADQVGRFGLQAAFERQLAGVPEGYLTVVDKGGVDKRRLAHFAGREGTAVRTTIDDATQDAAERALSTVDKPAALVAVKASTGELLAVANRPVDDSYDRALVGRYPPGSTFKVVTTTALLDHTALRPDTTVPCPKTITAGGKSFRNFEGETAGSPTFRKDFAISCNTAFIRLAGKLGKGDLPAAAKTYGFGADYKLGVPAYSGQAPAPKDTTEQAATSIGQGRVLASPLTMALVAGAVRSGTWHPPTLVTSPKQAGQPKPVALDPKDAKTMRSLMRSVVTSGTARGLAGTSGAVSGKTGTAEFGSANPPRTHAWFIGFRGDVAFAVLVEDGGVGGKDAVPVAKAFLNRH